MSSAIMQSLHISHCGVLVNLNVNVFHKPRCLTDKKNNNINYLPWIHTRITQIILCIIFFNVCSNDTMFELRRTRIQATQFAVCISVTAVTLKQSQGHQTYCDRVDPKQSYNHTKLKDLAFCFQWQIAIWKINNKKNVTHCLCVGCVYSGQPGFQW